MRGRRSPRGRRLGGAVAALVAAGTIAVGASALAVGGGAAGSASRAAAEPVPTTQRGAAVRPEIHKWLIPYGTKRRREMAAYSRRHYGRARYELTDPKLIVEHYAQAGSVRAIYNTFAPDNPDLEFGELPGVCSHYAVAADGRIFRFVPDGIRCRHVVGLNHVAIGIEHVGFSDADVLGRKRQLRASLRLSRWLRCRYGLPVKQVIGHNESLDSRFYKELDPDFRGQTHGDFKKPSMRIYRRQLTELGGCPG